MLSNSIIWILPELALRVITAVIIISHIPSKFVFEIQRNCTLAWRVFYIRTGKWKASSTVATGSTNIPVELQKCWKFVLKMNNSSTAMGLFQGVCLCMHAQVCMCVKREFSRSLWNHQPHMRMWWRIEIMKAFEAHGYHINKPGHVVHGVFSYVHFEHFPKCFYILKNIKSAYRLKYSGIISWQLKQKQC